MKADLIFKRRSGISKFRRRRHHPSQLVALNFPMPMPVRRLV